MLNDNVLDPFLRPKNSFGSKYNPMLRNPSQGTTIHQQSAIEELGIEFDQRTDRGVIQGNKLAADSIGTGQIANNSVGSNALTTNAVSSIKIQASAVTNAKINDVAWTKLIGGTGILGDAANAQGVFQLKDAASAVIGTMSNVGVQFYAGTLGTMTIGTSLVQGGTANNQVIGTPNLTGGTVNAGTYQVGGTAGVSATLVYVKDLVPNLGTIVITRGIITTAN